MGNNVGVDSLSNLSKIKQALESKKYASLSSEDSLFNIYCYMMDHYGYIPFDQFLEMPLFLTIDIVRLLEKQDDNARKKPRGVGR